MKAGRENKKRSPRQGGKTTGLMGGRAWLAVGTIAAYAAAGGASKSALLHASPVGGGHQESQAQLTVRRFDIPAGPLDVALAQYAKECGLTVGFTIPKETLPGFKSRGVSGLYSDREALKQLLAGTGLDFSFSGPESVSIGVKSAQSVQVKAVADTLALAKNPLPLVDTPKSITAIPQHVIAEQGVSTLATRCATRRA